jgi:hypothetical protein
MAIRLQTEFGYLVTYFDRVCQAKLEDINRTSPWRPVRVALYPAPTHLANNVSLHAIAEGVKGLCVPVTDKNFFI